MKLKDYPHLMMELFEVAAGNWCVVVVPAAAAVSRIDKRISSMIICCTLQLHDQQWMVIRCYGKIYYFFRPPASLSTLNFGSNLNIRSVQVCIWSSLVVIGPFMLHHFRCKLNMRHIFLFLMWTNPPPIFRKNTKVERCVFAFGVDEKCVTRDGPVTLKTSAMVKDGRCHCRLIASWRKIR